MAITRAGASKVLGWPKYSYKRLKLTQLLGQLGVFLTTVARKLVDRWSRLYGRAKDAMVLKTPWY